MTSKFRDFFNAFRSFVNASGRSVLFTSLFYSIWLVVTFIISEKFELHSLSGRMIGSATLDNYDVGARVSLFYKCIALLPCSFVLMNLLAYFIFTKKQTLLTSVEVKLINYTSLTGIFLLVFQLYEFRVYETLEAVYFIHKLMLAGLLLKLLIFKRSNPSVSHYCIILALSTTFYFFVADIFNIVGYFKNPDFFITTFIFCLAFLVTLNFYLNKDAHQSNPAQLRSLVFGLLPLMALPLVSVLKDELFLILKANGVSLSGQFGLWLMLLMILLFIVFIRFRKTKAHFPDTESKMLALRYFPLFLFSLITYIYYNHFVEYYNEMFESGNRYLPVMEFKLFGVIPTFEKFNSHLFSDYFFSAIYTALNGMKLMEMELYDFLLIPISFTLYYYLIYFLSRSPFIALFSVLFFPFCSILLPDGYCFGIIALLVLHRILTTQASLKNYLILFISITLLIYWRSDLGFSCVMVIPLVLIYYNITDSKFNINWRHLIKALLIILGGVGVLIASLSAYRGVNIFYKILYALNYLSSAQTYGYATIGWTNLPAYKMHYFVFPILVCLILLALIFRFKVLNKTKGQRFSYLSLLFLCVYYFANFNRGLVRHSLIEWTDAFTSSYIYIIIPGAIFVFFKHRTQSIKYIAFLIITFLMMSNYTLPQTSNHKSVFEKGLEKIKTTPNINLARIKDRVTNLPKQSVNKHFIDFSKKYMPGEETFIDFTNNSMLYFYASKISPSYFYQNPLCSHNEFLQKRFIADLGDYKTPYLLFSTLNEKGYTDIDQVPNTLRHYRMAEFFYTHYQPYILIDNYCIWKNKLTTDRIKKDTLFTYKADLQNPQRVIEHEVKLKQNKKYLIYISHNGLKSPVLKCFFEKDSVCIIFDNIKDHLAYGTLDCKASHCHLKLQNDSGFVKKYSLVESEELPDFYSEKFHSYNFKKLPYVWGNFDKELNKEPVLFEDNSQVTLNKKSTLSLKIPTSLDKTSGNTLVLTCENKSKKIQNILLHFGRSSEKNKSIINFDVLPSDTEKNYAVRISSIYKWYSDKIDQIDLITESDSDIIVTKIQITKGN